MVRKTVTITVEALGSQSQRAAIASAASYLSYADHTDTIGYNPGYSNIRVVEDTHGPTMVIFDVTVGIGADRVDDFLDHMNDLAKVKSIEETS